MDDVAAQFIECAVIGFPVHAQEALTGQIGEAVAEAVAQQA